MFHVHLCYFRRFSLKNEKTKNKKPKEKVNCLLEDEKWQMRFKEDNDDDHTADDDDDDEYDDDLFHFEKCCEIQFDLINCCKLVAFSHSIRVEFNTIK